MSFQLVRKGELAYWVSTEITVPHCFTTRLGGVSEGYLSSMNLGIGRGDKPENVRENYRILGEAVGFTPDQVVFSCQVHEDTVERVGQKDRFRVMLEQPHWLPRDGLVTNETETALTVFSADCTTVLLHDPVKKAVAAVHSGWRGTAKGIVLRAVEAMQREFGSDPADLRAAIGPCISRCCFETHREVPDAMLAALGVDALPAVEAIPQREGKYLVDLKMINEIWLRKGGVDIIDVCPDCTACDTNRYWSHRRTGGERGSLAAIIMLPREGA